MPRFFVPSENFSGGRVLITGDDAFHIARSLRMAVGDTLTVCDMHSREHSCRLTKIRDSECECEILSTTEGKTESPVYIKLYMAYPKGDKLETVVQKAVELGASEIIPFESSRCIKKPKPEKEEREHARLTRIAEEAAKQCGRSRLVKIGKPLTFADMLSDAQKSGVVLFCYEGDGTVSLKTVLSQHSKAKELAVVVGSEGGFSRDEAGAAIASGATLVNLGPRILRCETAPSYVLAVISCFYEL